MIPKRNVSDVLPIKLTVPNVTKINHNVPNVLPNTRLIRVDVLLPLVLLTRITVTPVMPKEPNVPNVMMDSSLMLLDFANNVTLNVKLVKKLENVLPVKKPPINLTQIPNNVSSV